MNNQNNSSSSSNRNVRVNHDDIKWNWIIIIINIEKTEVSVVDIFTYNSPKIMITTKEMNEWNKNERLLL